MIEPCLYIFIQDVKVHEACWSSSDHGNGAHYMGSKEEIPLASLDQKIGTFQTVTRYAQFASDANVDMGDQSERLLVYRQPYRFRRITRLRGFFYQSAQVRAHSHLHLAITTAFCSWRSYADHLDFGSLNLQLVADRSSQV